MLKKHPQISGKFTKITLKVTLWRYIWEVLGANLALRVHFGPLFGATWATLGDWWDHFGPIGAQCAIRRAQREPRESQENPKRAP